MPVWWRAKSPAASLGDWAGSGSLASVLVSGRWDCSHWSRGPADVPSCGIAVTPWRCRDPLVMGLCPRAQWRLLAEGQGLLASGSTRQKRVAGTDGWTQHGAWRGLQRAVACRRVLGSCGPRNNQAVLRARLLPKRRGLERCPVPSCVLPTPRPRGTWLWRARRWGLEPLGAFGGHVLC